MRRRRACHIVQTLYSTDPRIRKQVEALADDGFDVDVVCLREPANKPIAPPDGVRYFYAPLAQRRGGTLRYLFEYAAFFAYASMIMLRNITKRYDVIHVSNMPDILVFSTLLPRLFGSKVLLDIHDPMPELFVSKYGISPNSRMFRVLSWQEKVSMNYAHHVITVAQPVVDCLRPLAPKKDISVVMNLSDLESTEESPDGGRTSRDDGTLRIIYLGTIAPRYGVSVVVDCIAQMKAEFPGLRLLLVGGGDDVPRIQDMIRDRELDGVVELLGWVASSQIHALLSTCDIGIAPIDRNQYADMALPTKVLEYLAMGLPTIATRTTILEQLVSESVVRFYESGDVDSLAQAITDLYKDSSLLAEMSRKSIAFAKTMNWSLEKPKYLDIIKRLCGRNAEHSLKGS